MLQKLPIAHGQVKTGNTSENVLHEKSLVFISSKKNH